MKIIEISCKRLSRIQAVLGLIPYKEQSNIFFKTHFGIHTFGVKFPIDVLILDSSNNVITMKKGMRPFSVFLWNPIFNNVLELKVNTIAENLIEIGDQVKLNFNN